MRRYYNSTGFNPSVEIYKWLHVCGPKLTGLHLLFVSLGEVSDAYRNTSALDASDGSYSFLILSFQSVGPAVLWENKINRLLWRGQRGIAASL